MEYNYPAIIDRKVERSAFESIFKVIADGFVPKSKEQVFQELRDAAQVSVEVFNHIFNDYDRIYNQNRDLIEESELKWFAAYTRVKLVGNYNMYMECDEAAKEAGLTPLQYDHILQNYSYLYEYPKFKEIHDSIDKEILNELINSNK